MAVVQGKTYRIKSHAGEGLCLRLYSGSQAVAQHKYLQTATESTTNMGQRWVVKNISGRKIVSAIDNSYALNFDTTDTTRKAEIYQYSNSDANTSLEFEKVDLSNNIYKIKITISGTTYYLTAGSKTSTAYATWEPASGGDNQKWQFVEVETYTYPTTGRNLYQDYSTSHPALDIVGEDGRTPIYAFADGIVSYTQTYNGQWYTYEDTPELNGDSMESMGNMIAINHNNPDSSIEAGTYARSIYMHMHAPSTLANGSSVQKGDIIGYVGNTGRSNTPHLHFCLSVGNLSTMSPGAIGWVRIIDLPNKDAVSEYLPEYEL